MIHCALNHFKASIALQLYAWSKSSKLESHEVFVVKLPDAALKVRLLTFSLNCHNDKDERNHKETKTSCSPVYYKQEADE